MDQRGKSSMKSGGRVFFVLRVTPVAVQVGVGAVRGGGVLLSRSGFVPWGVGRDEGVKQVDQAISEAVENLQGLARELEEGWGEPEEILFGVPASWVHDHQLLPTHKKVLKEVVRRLELKPLGFVVTAEALVRWLGGRQKFPLTALLVEVVGGLLEVSWVRSGKTWVRRAVKRQGGVIDDLVKALRELPSSLSLPPKLVVFNAGDDLKKEVQKMVSFSWDRVEGLRFDHLPEVVKMSAGECLEALVGVVGEQVPEGGVAGGAEGGGSLGKERDGQAELVGGKLPSGARQMKSVGEVGFVFGRDIGESPKLGVASSELQVKSASAGIGGEKRRGGRQLGRVEESEVETRRRWRWPRGIWVGFLGLPLVLGLLGLAYWYFSSAELTLTMKPTLIEERVDLRVDPEVEELDWDQGVVPGRLLEAEVEIERVGAVTGEKMVGEKARGRVKIFNDTSSEQVFAVGEELVADNGLEFVLDEEVKVASKSVDFGLTPPFRPGEAEAGITAAEIGAEYNLSKGVSFSVANLAKSSVVARSSEDFLGGVARQVKAVSGEDRQGLFEEAREALEKKGREELAGRLLEENEQLVDESVELERLVSEFDHEVGDEVEELRLKLSGNCRGVAFGRGDIDRLAGLALEKLIPQGLTVVGDVEVSFDKVVMTEEGVRVEVVVRASLLPEIDELEIKGRIRGRSPESVESYLRGLPGHPEVRMVFGPFSPGWLMRFPFREEKIRILVQSAD